MELSLFAEAFQEMLARDFGERILKALYEERYCLLANHMTLQLFRGIYCLPTWFFFTLYYGCKVLVCQSQCQEIAWALIDRKHCILCHS
jgi:hypothetical protein